MCLIIFLASLCIMKLDQFLKLKGLASTGGEAKHLIIAGLVRVNGAIELRRGRKLSSGDRICFQDQQFLVQKNQASA